MSVIYQNMKGVHVQCISIFEHFMTKFHELPEQCSYRSRSIGPFLKNNGGGPHNFSGMDRYKDFLRLKIHFIQNMKYFDGH